MPIEEFRKLVRRCLEETVGMNTPQWFEGQPDATAFSVRLTCELAPLRRTRKLIGAPHSQKTRDIVESFVYNFVGEWKKREWMIDFVVAAPTNATLHKPIIACESEMYPGFGVDYNFEWEDGLQPRNGYVWDFRKLLFFQAPRLLFVARVNKAEEQIETLKATLRSCARDYADYWKKNQIFIVILPAAPSQMEYAAVGISGNDAEIAFVNLGL